MLRKIVTIVALVCLVTSAYAAWGTGQTTETICRNAPEGSCTSTPDGPGSKQMCCEIVFDSGSSPKTFVTGSNSAVTAVDLYDQTTGMMNKGQRGLGDVTSTSTTSTNSMNQQRGQTVFCYKKHGNIQFARYLNNPEWPVFSEVYVEPTLQNSPFSRDSVAGQTFKKPCDTTQLEADGYNLDFFMWDECKFPSDGTNPDVYAFFTGDATDNGREYAMKQPFYHPQGTKDGFTPVEKGMGVAYVAEGQADFNLNGECAGLSDDIDGNLQQEIDGGANGNTNDDRNGAKAKGRTSETQWCNSMVGWGLPYKFHTKKCQEDGKASSCPTKPEVPTSDSTYPLQDTEALPCSFYTTPDLKAAIPTGTTYSDSDYSFLEHGSTAWDDHVGEAATVLQEFTACRVAPTEENNANYATELETYQNNLYKQQFPRNWINWDPRVKNMNGMDEVPFSPVPNSRGDPEHPGYEVAQVKGDQFCASVGTELSATIIWGTSHRGTIESTSSDSSTNDVGGQFTMFKGKPQSCSCTVTVSDSMFTICGLTFVSILITLWRGL